MSFKGRGSIFSFLSESDSDPVASTSKSSNTDVKDSGVGVETQTRSGRGKLLDDLVSSTSSLSLGKGRARLFQSITSDNSGVQLTSSPKSAGRGALFKHVKEDIEITTEEPKTETTTQKVKVADEYFQPQRIQGSAGEKKNLTCNYIQLECDKSKGVFVYEVRFHPSVDSCDLRMKYLNEHRNKLGNVKTFDGIVLYLPILLEEKLTTCVSKGVDGSDIEVRILFKRKQALKDCIHLYNILFDRVMKQLKYVKFIRKQFDPTAPKIIPQAKLEVWPGYITAVDEYDGGLMLCCDVSHRILCQQTVWETLNDIYRSDANNFQTNAKKALLGSVIITRYNNRTYRIDDIYFDQSPRTTFAARDKVVSYLEYYKTNHNITIKDSSQPLLASIKKVRCSDKTQTEELIFCLVPELCHLTGLSDQMRNDFKLMRDIATFTRVSPNQRLQALQKFHDNVTNSPEAKQILQNWGLSLNGSSKSVVGRQLDTEQILFATKSYSAGPCAEFSKFATSNELLSVVNFRNWLLVHVKNNSREAKSFCEHMDRCTKALGMNISTPKVIILENDRVDTYINCLRSSIKKETQIVVIICPTMRDDRYSAIKKLLCSEIPIPSQVINAKTLSNEIKNRSICQKIALQMNCKLGGTLWAVKIPFKRVMICGIDSYHDPAQKSNSVAAFVSSLNATYTRWFSKAVLQTKREEIVSGLCSSFIAALRAYINVNNGLPDNVIIYRDGVGDGQLPLCSSYEIPQFENAMKKEFSGASIKITFIVVQKRINTKYFQMKNGEALNPDPGTVLDNTVTRRNMYDFFLVSQFSRQGTVTPSHYVVLRDDANFEPDIIQRLSYKLCFLYYNWPGTIRVPACCQYAHKMAYLIGQNVRRLPAEELLDKLFYL